MAQGHSPAQSMRHRPESGGIVAHAQSVQYVGPTPPPEHVEAYERILPGAAERFLKIAEEEVAHRRKLEDGRLEMARETARTNRLLARWGQWFAFLIAMSGIAGGVYLASNGAEVAGGIIGGGGLVTIILGFLRKSKDD